MNDTSNEARAIAELTRQGMEIRQVGGIPIIINPKGETLSLESYLPAPARKHGTTTLHDATSFVGFVKKHASPAAEIYRRADPPMFVAVFNAHQGNDEPTGWGDHRATYACPLSVEWKTWTASNKKTMSQEAFAQFIEDNLPDMVRPAAAQMLEISRTLQAKKKVNFASGIRLANGENQLTYEETVQGTAGSKGQLKVPEVFTIGIPVFEGGQPYAVTARLRYRIADGGTLTMWFDLERPHKIIEDAVLAMTKQIEEATGLVTINGIPA